MNWFLNFSTRAKLSQTQASQYARSLIEASLDPLVTISPEGKITDVNEGSIKVTGVPRDGLIGTDFSNYFTEPEKAREGYQQVFAKGFVTDYPLTIRHKDGRLTDVLYNASVYKDAAGKVLGVFAAARDVTVQKQASQYARSLIEASLDPLVTISPEGKITDVNEGSIKVTGVRRDELIGTDFSNYFTEPEKAREGYQQVFAKGFVTDYPLTIRHKDGRLTDVLYNASVYKDVAGNVLGVFAAARDVTESKRVMREFAEMKNLLDNILQSSIKYSIIGKDLDHRILSWNEGARRNYGYTAEEILGKNSEILHTPEDIKSGAVAKLLATAQERGLAEGEFVRVRKDGSRFAANVVVTRRNDAAGNPIGYLLMSNDISEKKQAEEQLRFASQYARSLIEASLDPLVTISAEGKITDVNEGSIKVTGVRRDELIGTDFSNYFTEPEKAREGYQQVFAKGFVTDYPLTIRHRDGKLTDVLYNASVYKDVAGKVLGVFAAARDVTVQKQASQYARSLIEASLDPLVTISAEGKITDVNEGSTKVTGVPRDGLIGTDFSNYFTEPEKAREGYQQVFAKGFVTDYPLTIRHKDGRLTDVLYNASVYKDVAGNVLGVFAAARDVTESKRVMREFAEMKNLLDNILQSSIKYSIIGKDLDHRVLSWNEGGRRNYGYTAEEILGKNSDILHTPEDIKSGAVAKLLAAAHEKGLAEGEFERVRKDGSRFVASVVVTRRSDASGKPIGYLLMSNDISEKKQAEEQLRFASQYARSLIEASLDPLVTISPEGKITDVNEGSIKATGVRRDELIGTDFSNYFTEPEKARAGYREVFAKGFVTDYPLTIRHRDGKLTDVLYNASVYKDARGNALGVFAAARDITVQKQAEEALRKAHAELELRVQERTTDLEKLVQQVREGIKVLGSGTGEILAATNQVASSSTETATSVEQTTATVEEVKQTAQVASQKAKHVLESAQKLGEVSQTGKKSVDETIEGMRRIREQMESIAESIVRLSEQSQAIGEIVATVNDLSDQSNLLAVNAAIEAAKAGEQGKGFGVVAQEIKSLATQSKQATAQVRTILGDIQKATGAAVMATEQGAKAVEAGVQRSTQAGESIRLLADSITEAAQAATQIAASSQQQTVGMDQVVMAMENIKQASAQNVTSTRQAEVAAKNLHELGQKLSALIESKPA